MRYHFGTYTLDTRRYELHRAGTLVSLRRKVFQVLAYLLEHHDRVIAKQELMEQVWPGQFISDETLSTCITAARKALGDSGQHQAMIQTRLGLGYRFVAPVQVQHDEANPTATLQRGFSPFQVSPPSVGDTIPTATSLPALAPAVSVTSSRLLTAHQPALSPAIVGEVKPVTVLVGRLHRAVALAKRLDPEALHHTLRAFFALVHAEIQRYGGTLQRRLDDGFVALFGAPVAQEDHARRAVLAALGVQQRLQDDGADAGLPPGVPLAIGLGLHTGRVLVGPLADDSELTYTPVGDTLRLATRLARQARSGAILLSAATRRLVQGYVHLEGWAPRRTPGHTTPSSTYTVRGLGPRRTPLLTGGARPLSPFVGRQRELTTLQALLEQVERGQGQVVGIVGEPGMGKSRLVYEFRRGLRDDCVHYLEGRCASYGRETPYLLVRDLLRQRCGIVASDSPAVSTTKVHQCLQEVGMAPEDAAPYLLYLLDIAESSTALAGLSPQVIRARTFTALHQLLLASSQHRPLVIEVEDLHWIDPTSEACLVELVERLAGVPLLLLLTFRPGYRPAWMDKSYATQLTLPPLSAADSRGIVQAVFYDEPVPESLVQAMLAKAAGNPFFLEELSWVVREHSDVHLPPQIPDTVSAVLASRIDRLPAEIKHLLQVAAVVGQELPLALLEAVAEQAEEELRYGLRALQVAEFLAETRLVPEPVYTFKHALIQEVAYQSLLTRPRQQMHRRIAQALEERFAATVQRQPELLAHHLTEAGLPAQAIVYWQRAGQQAYERSAYVEAHAHLTRGLALLRTLADTPERTQQDLEMQLLLAHTLVPLKGITHPDVERAYARAHDLCRQLGETPQLFAALVGLYAFYLGQARYQTAQELAEQKLTLAQRQHVADLLAGAHLFLGEVLFYQGVLATARTHLEHARALYNPKAPRAVAWLVHPLVGYHNYAAWTLWLLGYPDQARIQRRTALTLAQDLAHPFTAATAQCFASALHQYCREAQAVQASAEKTLALATTQGFPYWAAWGNIFRGWALAVQGQGTEGIAQLRQGWEMRQAMGAKVLQTYVLAMLVEAYAYDGQVEQGRAVLAEALAMARNHGERYYEAELHRLRGELLVRDGNRQQWAEAEACFQHALDVAQRQQAKALELRAALSLSRLWQQQGKRDAARALLVGVYHWFTEGFDTTDLQEARALLQVL